MAKDRQIVLTSTLVVGVALIHPVTDALAQNITLDGSLGIAATLTGPNYVIPQSVGQTVGNNLFHSFGKFNLTANEAAIFQSADNIRNILSRVTDGSPSSIDGLIRTLGSDVNFFLINPSGMIFGQNARLDVSGSFVASTANAIKFGNQGFFNTITPEVPSPLLTVNPSALFFNQLQVGRIENKSIAPAGDNLFGLRVPDGRSLLLVGGDIASNGGRLNAPGGRVELAGVAGVGTVGLNVDGKNLSLSVPENLGLADINFTNQSLINTSSDGSGGIRMWGRSIYFSEQSSVIAHTQGSLDGDDIEMRSQQFKLEDSSYISASTFGTGKSGNILISANKSVELFGPGFAQNINKRRLQVFAGTLNPLDQQGGLFVSTIGRGKVGNIRIETENLSLKNGALIFSSTFGQEAGGNLNFSVSKSLEVIGSAIFSGTQRGTTGAGGKIAIDTGKLIIRDGGLVSNATFGSGSAGTLSVDASDTVEIDLMPAENLSDAAGLLLTGIVNSTVFGTGAASDITINTPQLLLRNGASVQTQSGSFAFKIPTGGQGGNLIVKAKLVELTGISPSGLFPTNLSAETFTTGDAGSLIIETEKLILRDGGQIEASSGGAGRAGKVFIHATDLVEVDGTGPENLLFFRSAILGSSGLEFFPNASGSGGNIRMKTAELIVRNGGEISVRSFGTADAGFFDVSADSIKLDNKGRITASTASGEGGNITLQVKDILQLRRGSSISVEAGSSGNGGNIEIDSKFIVAVLKENSDITANAFRGDGGRVIVTSGGIFGIQPQQRSIELSDMTASSELGVNGQVSINTLEVNPSHGLVQLPSNLVDASQQIASSCTPREGQNTSRFIATGRSGLPLSPYEPLRGQTAIAGWVNLPQEITQTVTERSPAEIVNKNSIKSHIVEAQGWIVDTNGDVILMARSPQMTSSMPSPMFCNQ